MKDVGLSKMLQMLDSGKPEGCTCPSAKAHKCPFASEIHGDLTQCTCCAVCEDECAQDI